MDSFKQDEKKYSQSSENKARQLFERISQWCEKHSHVYQDIDVSLHCQERLCEFPKMKAKELAQCSLRQCDYQNGTGGAKNEKQDLQRQYGQTAQEMSDTSVSILNLFVRHCRIDLSNCNCIQMLKSIVEMMDQEKDPWIFHDEYYEKQKWFPTLEELKLHPKLSDENNIFKQLYNETMLLRLFEFSLKQKCPILQNEFIYYQGRRTNKQNIFWLFKLVNLFKKPTQFHDSVIKQLIDDFVSIMKTIDQNYIQIQNFCKENDRHLPNKIEQISLLLGITDYFDCMDNLCLMMALQHKDITYQTEDQFEKIKTINEFVAKFQEDEKKYLKFLKMAPTTDQISNSKLFKQIDFTEIKIEDLQEMQLQKLIDPYIMEAVLKMRVTKDKAAHLDPPVPGFPVLSNGDLPLVEHGHNYKAPEYVNMSKSIKIFSLTSKEGGGNDQKDRKNRTSQKTFNRLYLFAKNQDKTKKSTNTTNMQSLTRVVSNDSRKESGIELESDQQYNLNKIDKIINIGIFSSEKQVREYNKSDN